MTSNDNQHYITVEVFNSAMTKIDKRFDIIDNRFISLDKTLSVVGYELKLNARDTEHLQTSVYWGFAILGIILTIVGFVVTLAPMFRDMYHDAKKSTLRNEIRNVMQEEIEEAVKRALSMK